MLLNSLWIFSIVWISRAMSLRRSAARASVVVLAATPLVIFNTTYVWPKMLAAAYACGGPRVSAPGRVR